MHARTQTNISCLATCMHICVCLYMSLCVCTFHALSIFRSLACSLVPMVCVLVELFHFILLAVLKSSMYISFLFIGSSSHSSHFAYCLKAFYTQSRKLHNHYCISIRLLALHIGKVTFFLAWCCIGGVYTMNCHSPYDVGYSYHKKRIEETTHAFMHSLFPAVWVSQNESVYLRFHC